MNGVSLKMRYVFWLIAVALVIIGDNGWITMPIDKIVELTTWLLGGGAAIGVADRLSSILRNK